MTDRAYGYYELDLFTVKINLKLCMSYPSEESLKNFNVKIGVNGRALNRVYVLKKEDSTDINKVDDIEKIIKWGEWDRYLNVGTVSKPQLKSLNDIEGLKDILDEDKKRSESKIIKTSFFYPLDKIGFHQFNGRQFHTYPQSAKQKNSSKDYFLYNLIVSFLEEKKLCIVCFFYGKGEGEEIGIIYNHNGVLRISGIHPDSDLKPVEHISQSDIGLEVKQKSFEVFSKLIKEEGSFVLEWRDYLKSVFENQGIGKKSLSKQVVDTKQLNEDVLNLISSLNFNI